VIAGGLSDRMVRGARELSDDAVRDQAEQLRAFIARGGSGSRWFASKDLTFDDRARILVALGDLEEGGA